MRLSQVNYVTIAHNHGHRNELSQTGKKWVHYNIKAAQSVVRRPGRVRLQTVARPDRSKISTAIRSLYLERCIFSHWIMSIESKNLIIKMGLAFYMSFSHLIFPIYLLLFSFFFEEFIVLLNSIGLQWLEKNFLKVSYHSRLIRWSQAHWKGQRLYQIRNSISKKYPERDHTSLPYTDLSQQC